MERNPFYFDDEPEGETSSASEGSLVVCETKHALFTALALRTSGIIAQDSDLIFTDSQDFSTLSEALERECLFRNIWHVQTRAIVTRTIRMEPDERAACVRSPEDFMPLPFSARTYAHLWLNLDNLCPKYYFYALVNLGSAPEVHFLDEGNSSYCLNLASLKTDSIPHAQFKDNAFENRCKDIWLFQPGLFQPEKASFEVKEIPKDAISTHEFRSLIARVFGEAPLPEREFVFFEQCFSEDNGVTNDLEVVKHIAKRVGADNLEIRLHPRTKIDRFSPFGFKTVRSESSLWEAALLEHPDILDGKTFITVDSTAVFSPLKLLGKPSSSIILNRMIWGSYKGKDDRLKISYLEAAARLNNGKPSSEKLGGGKPGNGNPNDEGGARYHIPHSMQELDIVLSHIIRARSL